METRPLYYCGTDLVHENASRSFGPGKRSLYKFTTGNTSWGKRLSEVLSLETFVVVQMSYGQTLPGALAWKLVRCHNLVHEVRLLSHHLRSWVKGGSRWGSKGWWRGSTPGP